MLNYLGHDPAFIKFLLIGIFTGFVVTLDGYARGKILTPTKKNGEVHRIRTVALYLSIILFSSFAAIIMGTIAEELKLSSNMAFILAGLGGIVGRDIIHVLSQNFLKRVDTETSEKDDELTAFMKNLKKFNEVNNINNRGNHKANKNDFKEIDDPQKDSK